MPEFFNGGESRIEQIRASEYPLLNDEVYLDVAGSSIYAKSLVEEVSKDLLSHIYGNTHSSSPASTRSFEKIEHARHAILTELFHADPADFDIVFCANATAAIKTVCYGMNDYAPNGWKYVHQSNVHTSVLGMRSMAASTESKSDNEFSRWIRTEEAKVKEQTKINPNVSTPEVVSEKTDLKNTDFTKNGPAFSWRKLKFSTKPDLQRKKEVPNTPNKPQNNNNSKNGGTHLPEKKYKGIICWPGQCNFTGQRYPIRDYVSKARKNHPEYFTMVDAASLMTTKMMDLSDPDTSPDFITVSFYKIFGLPDLGALIVRKKAGRELFADLKYFGGGTLEFVTSEDRNYQKRNQILHEALEDGSLPFHSIITLDTALAVHKRIYGSLSNISSYTSNLAKYFVDRLLSIYLEENNTGILSRFVHIYTKGRFGDSRSQGPIISFNLRLPDGSWVPFKEFERQVSLSSMNIRTGRHCNPGAAEKYTEVGDDTIIEAHKKGLKCDQTDLIDGKPVGAIRISLGPMSSVKDADKFFDFLKEYYIEPYGMHVMIIPTADFDYPRRSTSSSILSSSSQNGSTASSALESARDGTSSFIKSIRNESVSEGSNRQNEDEEDSVKVESLTVFPIKSCAGFKVPRNTSWPVYDYGLAWDRQFCLVNSSAESVLTQSRFPQMALLHPKLDLDRETLTITQKAHHRGETIETSVSISLRDLGPRDERFGGLCTSRMCIKKKNLVVYESKALNGFFSRAIGQSCKLARTADDPMSEKCPDSSLVNDSAFLIVSSASVDYLRGVLPKEAQRIIKPEIFRGNIVVGGPGLKPFEEDKWKSIEIISPEGPRKLELAIEGACRRCAVVNVDTDEGTRPSNEPYMTLSKVHQVNGSTSFGVRAGIAAWNRPPLEAGRVLPQVSIGDRIIIHE